MHVPSRVIRPQGAHSASQSGHEPTQQTSHETAHETAHHTKWVAKAVIPTRHGSFETHIFRSARGIRVREGEEGLSLEHVALVFGDVGDLRGRDDVLVRVHSECMTSEVFGSLKCDCKEQLEASMAAVARAGAGAVLYLRQEGRGIGLANKIRAYALQSHGHDTVDANRLLGLPDDARSYEVARDMLAHFGVAGVRLLTNNPAKVSALRKLGVHVTGRVPVVVAPNQHSSRYLEAKRLRMEHDLPPDVTHLVPVAIRAASGDGE
jgi:GTP cyclohydrolase II